MQSTGTISQSLFWRSCSFFTSLLLTLLLARVLGPVASGELNYFIAMASLLVLLTSFNLDASIVHFTAGGRIQLNKILSICLLLVCASAILYFAFTTWWSGKNVNLAMNDFIPMAGIYLLGLQLYAMTAAIFYGRQQFVLPGLLLTTSNILLIVLLLFAFNTADTHSLQAFLRIFFILPLAQALLLLVWLRWKENYQLAFQLPDKGEWQAISRFSLVIFLTNSILFLVYRIDYWMLVQLDPSPAKMERLGNYIQASKIGHTLLIFSSAIGSAVFSASSAAGSGSPALTAYLCRITRLLLAGGLLFYIIFVVSGRYLLPLVYGDEFPLIYPCGVLLFPGIVLLMTVSITANYLTGINFVRINLIGVILALALILVGNYIFIPRYGIYAASAVSTAGYIIYALYMLANFRKHANCSWSELLFFKTSDLAQALSLPAFWRTKKNIR